MARYKGPEFDHCDRCPSPAGQLVRFFADGHTEALCHACWVPLSSRGTGEVKVIHWINRYGRIMFAEGATTPPFRVKHQ